MESLQTDRTLVGTVSRKVLCVLLSHQSFSSSASGYAPVLSWGTLECMYPDYPDVDSVSVTPSQR